MTEYSGPNLLAELSAKLESKREELSDFFSSEREKLPMPLYASVDIRDAGWKVAAVDANAYPAGFNNVSSSDLPNLSEQLMIWLKKEHPSTKWLHIWPESHTRNKGYVENLITLQQLFSLRPAVKWADYTTPIKNYFQCGSGTHPGGGITGSPGEMAAKKILGIWK